MSTTPIRFAASFRALASIDAAAGIIRGVSVITEGEAKGHGMLIDAATLAQVKQCAETYAGGLKVKISTQRGHLGDVAEIVGFLTNFRIEWGKERAMGDPQGQVQKLLADLHLLENSPHRAFIMELAEKVPDTFGLSISFSGPVERKDDAAFARCTEIYSADLVSEPAANPTGLFSLPANATAAAGQRQPVTQMEQTKPDPIAEIKSAIEGLSARLSKLEMPPAAAPKVEVEVESPEEMSAKLEKVADLAAKSALKAFAAQFGAPPAPASAAKETNSEAKPAVKKFEELVREHPEYSKSKKTALAAVISAHPKEYADYNARVRSGEIIMF